MPFSLPRLAFIPAALLCSLPARPASAQSTETIFGLVGTNGSQLDQVAISVNAAGAATSFTATPLIPNLASVSGITSTGNNVFYNALAYDPAANTLFLTVNSTSTTSQSAGNFTARSYALTSAAGVWTATQIYTLTQAAGTVDNVAAGTPGAINNSDGWFTKGAYSNGAYYVGIDYENTMLKLTLANGDTKAVTGTTVYSNISHGGADAGQGGDFLFDGKGSMYTAGFNAANKATFASETVANAESAAGSAWSANTTGTDFYQLGGLGNSSHLYAAGYLTQSLYSVTNYASPGATAPTFTKIPGPTGIAFVDLSDGVVIPVPEPAGVLAAVGAMAAAAGVRRRSRA